MLVMEFEWDPTKEESNLGKHGISFVAAARVLAEERTLAFPSEHGSERRWVSVGAHPSSGKVIAVVYTVRQGRYRIISARRARKDEETRYWERVREQEPKGKGGRAPDGSGDE